MSTVLAISVGGSCQPILTAIADFKPQFVCFLASTGPRGSRAMVDGEGAPCDAKPSIVVQSGLASDQYQVVEIQEPDSLQHCYILSRAVLANLKERYPGHDCVADYTGGTKTMSAALVLAALETNWDVSLVKGARTDLVKVTDGTEAAGLVNAWEVRALRDMEEARSLFNAYSYTAAEDVLKAALRSTSLSSDLQTRAHRWIVYCRGFDAWDRFDHARAYQVLQPFQSALVANWILLKKITGHMRPSGYEAVFDLLRNSERRAAAGRFDDAVARLYRACELLAQTRLAQREPALDSGDLDLARLPEQLRPQYQALAEDDGKVRLGLRQDYELLAQLSDPVGQIYQERQAELLDALRLRNDSIFAHGLSPLGRGEYARASTLFADLIRSACQVLGEPMDFPQFPLLVGDDLAQRRQP